MSGSYQRCGSTPPCPACSVGLVVSCPACGSSGLCSPATSATSTTTGGSSRFSTALVAHVSYPAPLTTTSRASEKAAMSATLGSKSCGSAAAPDTTVVTLAQAPPSSLTRLPHWPTETSTSTTSPGQSAVLPAATVGPPVPLPEHAARPAVARTATAERRTAERRGGGWGGFYRQRISFSRIPGKRGSRGGGHRPIPGSQRGRG